ncbi:hypothetical protein evm_010972 [Chilo suppressalis]|nr:hypothetical protein evm_010972 [Chilo suppressalis]
MGATNDLLKISFVIITLKYVSALNKYDDRYFNGDGQLSEIPSTFEVNGEKDFKKYANYIQALSAGKNVSVVYKVKVDLKNPSKMKTKIKNKRLMKKLRTKKYNVPLKRQSMKLSNFEVLLRKLAEENGQKMQNNVLPQFSTKKPDRIFTTKQIQMKYKPIISHFKTNYTKRIKPVRSKTITITN